MNNVVVKTTPRILWVDYLRSFITVLVIAHHASLAYTTFSVFNKEVYILSTHPVVDVHRWIGLDRFVALNDVFFMPLMFLIAGIFTIRTLNKKGPAAFLRDRCYRLLIPFLFAVTFLMPLAYYPAWLQGHDENIKAYLVDFFTIEGWPVGPPWFIWVLFTFNVLIALAYRLIIPTLVKAGHRLTSWSNHPYRVAGLFLLITCLLYFPAALYFGPYSWTGLGPFDFQQSRLLLYFGFFILGGILGISDFNKGIFSTESKLVKGWYRWVAGTVLVYLLMIYIPILINTSGNTGGKLITANFFAICCCFCCLSLLAIFKKFAVKSYNFWNSLSDNAYCMYLVHYVFIVWSQYAMLKWNEPGFLKFLACFIFSTAGSWVLSILLRRIPIIKKYV